MEMNSSGDLIVCFVYLFGIVDLRKGKVDKRKLSEGHHLWSVDNYGSTFLYSRALKA